jgi:L-ribulose-5-phosphate 3-epimerase
MHNFLQHLGVCSWSLRPSSADDLICDINKINIRQVQLALDPIRENPSAWNGLPDHLARNNIRLVSGMVTCVGEDYTTPETIRRTGGLVPDHTWSQNLENFRANAELARQLGITLIGFHAGFLPHDASDPFMETMLTRLRTVADLFAGAGITVALETGQETAGALKEFLAKLDHPGVTVNFDPANMILYQSGDPIEALRVLGPWIRQCHIKDANPTAQPGTWGEEVQVGTGQVTWARFFQTLAEVNFAGYCCIEREAGEQRVEDIAAAKHFLETLFSTTQAQTS